MRLLPLALALVVAPALLVRGEPTPDAELLMVGDPRLNMRTGGLGMEITLFPTGPFAPRIRAGRMTIARASDDTGSVLYQVTTGRFYTVSVGSIDNSKDLTSREAPAFSLWGLSAKAASLAVVDGTLELVVPDLDLGAVVVVDNLPAKLGLPLISAALARAGVTLTVWDLATAQAAAAAKAPGGPQDYDAGPYFGPPTPHLPPSFRIPKMEPTALAVGLGDADGHVLAVEFQNGDGTPLTYNHNGNYHSSDNPDHPGKRMDAYDLGQPLPPQARLVCWLVTPRSLLRLPFHVEHLLVPAHDQHDRVLGTVTIRVDDAVESTRGSQAYDEASAATSRGRVDPEDSRNLGFLWADHPDYVAILKSDARYKVLPRLIASAPPDKPVWLPTERRPQITVLVSAAIDRTGTVADARVQHSDDPRFDASAVDCVRRWKFHPAENEAGPALCFASIPFVFKAPAPPPPPN